ncbi:MAG: sensor histidine kinase [Chloroflexota bacterium]
MKRLTESIHDGIGLRIALAALTVGLAAIAILAIGIAIVGGRTFADLMSGHGGDTAAAQSMFEEAIGAVLAVAVLVAIAVAALLAIWLGRRLSRPLREASAAAARIADGDYAARMEPVGPVEVVSLVESFNQMAASLEEQERMRREFIANAAHELRTPLTNLQGYLEALRDGVVAPDRATFESLWEEADRLVRLSRSLDELASGDAGTTEAAEREIDLADAIRTAVDLARPGASAAGLELRAEVPGSIPARADPDRLAQVLANLLQNAVRYTKTGGTVTVAAERGRDDIVVSVTNTGEAIPADDLPHVFERFYRVEKSRDRSRGGAGIGLAIVQQLVESAGGRVGAESVAGRTRFWFSLPG